MIELPHRRFFKRVRSVGALRWDGVIRLGVPVNVISSVSGCRPCQQETCSVYNKQVVYVPIFSDMYSCHV